MQMRPYILKNSIQHYQWGTRDSQAYIPKFLGITPEPGKPYAELWMGAHPKAPSVIIENGNETPLDKMIEKFPIETLGKEVIQEFNGKLPFLFKILSIGEPLSIQAHPSKIQAHELHRRDPVNYPDENHKPEIAVALDSLTALCGFRPVDEIKDVFQKYNVLSLLLDDEGINELNKMTPENTMVQKNCLKKVYSKLMNSPSLSKECFREVIDKILEQISSADIKTERDQLFLNCSKQYPYDVGLISILLLSLVHLKSGEGLFMGPGIPHAYLQGNIVECMANSDNVIRAGLTPKIKDIQRLTEVLTYKMGNTDLISNKGNAEIQIYQTPVKEFELSRINLRPGNGVQISRTSGPEILLIFKGEPTFIWKQKERQKFHEGQVLFIPSALGDLGLLSESQGIVFRVKTP